MASPRFAPGTALAEAFYREVLEPVLAGVPHSAGLLGPGSEVLGFDSERSTDHEWGPRAQLFVPAEHVAGLTEAVERALPDHFRAWPTRFGSDRRPVGPRVEVTTLTEWLRAQLGVVPTGELSHDAWLALPQQRLLGVTAGAVFRDDTGALGTVRQRLAWYPDELWVWLLACQWRRIDQEEPFIGRTLEAGDDLGARLVTARLVRELMRLCFLLERRYAPYSKWFGSAFARLDCAPALSPLLAESLSAASAEDRQAAFLGACRRVAELHNRRDVTAPVDAAPRQFHDRPYLVLGAGRFVDACLGRITDPALRRRPLIGAVDQFVDSTDVLAQPALVRRIGSAGARAGRG
ncbi:MAG TPA: DUF4037 domain-containing protein [Acidimicrobiales bacterium]